MTAATLSLYAGNTQSGNKTIHVVPSSAAAPLSNANFNDIQFVSGGSATPTGPNTWMAVALEPAAMGWIARNGETRLAVINADDLNNAAPTEDNITVAGLSENASFPPYLTITYTTP